MSRIEQQLIFQDIQSELQRKKEEHKKKAKADATDSDSAAASVKPVAEGKENNAKENTNPASMFITTFLVFLPLSFAGFCLCP